MPRGRDLLSGAAFEGIMVRENGVVVEVNDQMCAMSGRAREEFFRPDRERTAALLREGEARLRSLIEATFDALVIPQRHRGGRQPDRAAACGDEGRGVRGVDD